jgi:hypothetical protein
MARRASSRRSFTAAEREWPCWCSKDARAQAASALGVRTRIALETWKNVRLKADQNRLHCLRVLGAALLVTESAASPH